MRASIGRVVHFSSTGPQCDAMLCRAAIVTEVGAAPKADDPPELRLHRSRDLVGLCVLNPNGQTFRDHVPQDEEKKRPGTWHWPEHVE